MADFFEYERRVAFCDTDAMGVTHHANYLRYLEEARVAWMRTRGLTHTHFPANDHVLALLHYQVWHLRPSRFEDLLRIRLQVRSVGLRIHYQYIISKDGEMVAEGETWHVPVDGRLKPIRMAADLKSALEKEKWIETWLSNS